MGETLNEIGQKLRSSREHSGMDVEEIAQRLKVSAHYLRALEEGDVENLPESVYVMGYITGYARVVGLPSEELVKSYREDLDVRKHDPLFFVPQLPLPPEPLGEMPEPRPVLPMIAVPLFLILLIAIIWLQSVLNINAHPAGSMSAEMENVSASDTVFVNRI